MELPPHRTFGGQMMPSGVYDLFQRLARSIDSPPRAPTP
jgi:hypothetical protein